MLWTPPRVWWRHSPSLAFAWATKVCGGSTFRLKLGHHGGEHESDMNSQVHHAPGPAHLVRLSPYSDHFCTPNQEGRVHALCCGNTCSIAPCCSVKFWRPSTCVMPVLWEHIPNLMVHQGRTQQATGLRDGSRQSLFTGLACQQFAHSNVRERCDHYVGIRLICLC